MVKHCLTILLLSLVMFVSNSYAQNWNRSESILNFDVTIIVNRDASIDISEKITAFANRSQIIHGLVRRLPTRYIDDYGISRFTDYQIQQILVNNLPSPYFTEREHNHLIIYIGEKNVVLKTGEYTFTLNYHVNNAINFLKDADELYWNITGNEWPFPIEKVLANITLPSGAEISHYAGYIGLKGERGQNFTVTKTAPNIIIFVTKKPLLQGQGITVAISWPKGFVQPPSFFDNLLNQFQINRGQYIVLELSILLLIYYLVVWNLYGRDRKTTTIVPLFESPLNLSPAAIRFIRHMGFDAKTMSAAIVSMATKGFISITDENEKFILKKQTADESKLDESEKAFAKELFGTKKKLELNSDNADLIQDARDVLSQKLTSLYRNVYFVTNTMYFWIGVCITVLAFIAAIFSSDDIETATFSIIFISFWTYVCYILVLNVFSSITLIKTTPSIGNIFKTFFLLIFAVLFLIGEIFIIYTLTMAIPIFTVPLLFFMCVLVFLFHYLLKAPTLEGKKVMNQIDGFKMFLATTERYRLEQFTPPEKTPALFEKYLPYAIALSVENQWATQFSEILESASVDGKKYQPSWYSGTAWSNTSPSNFPSVLSCSLLGALAISSVSSANSASGGGSSGSSGGGGGGGGGGGW